MNSDTPNYVRSPDRYLNARSASRDFQSYGVMRSWPQPRMRLIYMFCFNLMRIS